MPSSFECVGPLFVSYFQELLFSADFPRLLVTFVVL
jgi:hypothetical protein